MTGITKASLLYRAILREHRNRLPAEMRALGDTYVKAEFHQHKTAGEAQVKRFFTAWNNYLTLLCKQNDQEGFGRPLDEDSKNLLSPEQQQKVEDLKREAIEATRKEY
jgi:hypothetical protein